MLTPEQLRLAADETCRPIRSALAMTLALELLGEPHGVADVIGHLIRVRSSS